MSRRLSKEALEKLEAEVDDLIITGKNTRQQKGESRLAFSRKPTQLLHSAKKVDSWEVKLDEVEDVVAKYDMKMDHWDVNAKGAEERLGNPQKPGDVGAQGSPSAKQYLALLTSQGRQETVESGGTPSSGFKSPQKKEITLMKEDSFVEEEEEKTKKGRMLFSEEGAETSGSGEEEEGELDEDYDASPYRDYYKELYTSGSGSGETPPKSGNHLLDDVLGTAVSSSIGEGSDSIGHFVDDDEEEVESEEEGVVLSGTVKTEQENEFSRPGNVINATSLAWESVTHGDTFEHSRRALSSAAGGSKLGCTMHLLAPGKTAYPYHYHLGNEEAIYVISGRGTLRLGDEFVNVATGDYIALPAGDSTTAHQLFNIDENRELLYLCMSTMNEPDVIVYPDSDKLGIVAGSAPGGKKEDRTMQEFFFRNPVSYWDGEDG